MPQGSLGCTPRDRLVGASVRWDRRGNPSAGEDGGQGGQSGEPGDSADKQRTKRESTQARSGLVRYGLDEPIGDRDRLKASCFEQLLPLALDGLGPFTGNWRGPEKSRTVSEPSLRKGLLNVYSRPSA